MIALAASDTPWIWSLLGLLSIPALVVLNGLFVAAEFALVGVRRTRVEELVKQGVTGSQAVESAITNLDRSIAATQLGITLASIGLGWVGEPALARLIDPLFAFLGEGRVVAAHSVATFFAFSLITFMHVVFGELIPKTVALQTRDATALWIAGPLNVFARLTRPLIYLMNGTGNAILRLCGYRPAEGEEMVHSIEELALLIEDTEEAGVIDQDQAEFVQNVFQLSDKTVADCMVPREKIAALELTAPPDKVLEAVRHGAHTRMPVYDTELDQIVGIVNTKDLFYLFSLRGVVVLEDALYPPLFLKPAETLGKALRLFRQSRRPMALVREEAPAPQPLSPEEGMAVAKGRILGLITLEDIVEQIVGDIEDEHDRPVPRLQLRKKRTLARPIPALKPTSTQAKT